MVSSSEMLEKKIKDLKKNKLSLRADTLKANCTEFCAGRFRYWLAKFPVPSVVKIKELNYWRDKRPVQGSLGNRRLNYDLKYLSDNTHILADDGKYMVVIWS